MHIPLSFFYFPLSFTLIFVCGMKTTEFVVTSNGHSTASFCLANDGFKLFVYSEFKIMLAVWRKSISKQNYKCLTHDAVHGRGSEYAEHFCDTPLN